MKKFGVFILIAIVLFGCSTSLPTNTPTETATSTITLTPRFIPGTSTFTPSPTITPIPTITPTSTPTSTPYPTLPPEQARNIFSDWMAGGPDCMFPCWAGIIPGETTFNEAKGILSPVTSIWRTFKDDECPWGPCSSVDWKFMHLSTPVNQISPINGVIVTNKDQIVDHIAISTYTEEYQFPLDHVLQEYGLPDQVLVHAPPNYLDNMWIWNLILSYPEDNFIIRYGRSAWFEGDKVVSCGPIKATDVIITIADGADWDKEKILRITYGERDGYIIFKDLEEVTDFTIESFHDYYIRFPNACFATPISRW